MERRMNRISRRLIAIFFVVGFALIASVSAQTGDDWRPQPCQLFEQSTTIFVGLTVGIREDPNPSDERSTLVQFNVSEAFKGIKQGTTVLVRTSPYFADYIETAVGKTFLVYASSAEEPGILSLNAPTKSLSSADREIGYLRGLNTSSPGTKIFGKVSFIAKSALKKDHKQPFSSGIIHVQQGEDKKTLREVRTDADGNYEVQGLSAGDYRVGAVIPETSNLYGYDQHFRVSGTGCVKADMEIKTANSVSGKVVDADGKPMAKVPLEMVPDDYVKPAYDVYLGAEITNSNDDGTFTFSNVPPGKYVLAINYTTLPEKESPYPTSFSPGTPTRGKAQVIEIGAGKEIEGIEFVLGPERLVEKKITGRVVFPDGRPSAGTTVYLKEDENQVCCVLKKAVTDAQGKFVLRGFGTRKYRVWAFIDHKPFTEEINFIAVSPVFILTGETGSFRIVLKPTVKDSLDALDEIEMRERGKQK